MTERNPARLKYVDFFAGIGGCAVAMGDLATCVAAIDIDEQALAIRRMNGAGETLVRTIESLTEGELSRWDADLWCLSPPCQPFTHQGARRGWDDHRSAGLRHLVRCIETHRPRYVALENVEPFSGSVAHEHLEAMLRRAGYRWSVVVLDPSVWGWMNRRSRFYLVAARDDRLGPLAQPRERYSRQWSTILAPAGTVEPVAEDRLLERRRAWLHGIRHDDCSSRSRCITSAYGRSPERSGSYVVEPTGRWRHFTPREVARQLGFPETFQWPATVASRTLWRLLGNSLSVVAVRRVLAMIPELATLATASLEIVIAKGEAMERGAG